MEIELIAKYKLTNRSNGYNISDGGSLGFSGNRKAVYMYDSKTGEFIKEFKSRNEAERFFGKRGNSIGKKNYENKKIYGYYWRDFKVDKIDLYEPKDTILLINIYGWNIVDTIDPVNFDFNFMYKEQQYLRSAIISRLNKHKYLYKNLYICRLSDYNTFFDFDNTYYGLYQIDAKTNNVVNVFSDIARANKVTGIKKQTIYEAASNFKKTGDGYIWIECGVIGKNIDNIEEKISILKNQYHIDDYIVEDFDLFRREDIQKIPIVKK